MKKIYLSLVDEWLSYIINQGYIDINANRTWSRTYFLLDELSAKSVKHQHRQQFS
jgi:hypothetical protein